MRNGHGLPVACSAPPPQSAVATKVPDGCQQTQQDEAISFGENDEVEEDNDSKLVDKKQSNRKTVNASAGVDAKGMMPPSEETNTANSAAENTCSNPNISSAQCGASSAHSVKDTEVKLPSSVVDSVAIRELLTSTLFNVNTKSVLHGNGEKSKKGKNLSGSKGIAAKCVLENKLWMQPSDFNNFDSVKNKTQLIRSRQHPNALNTYTDISSVSSEGLSSDEESGNGDGEHFEQFVVNDVGAINLVKGECSKTSSGDGASHHRTVWAKKVVESHVIADGNVQSAPLCLTVNKRPETQPVKSPPVKNYGLVLQQPSTFRHVSNPVSYSAFAPKYPARWPLLHIPFHSSGFHDSGIRSNDGVNLRDEQFRPQVQRRHSWDNKFPYDSDSDDLSSSDSDSSEDDLYPLINRVRSSSEIDSQQLQRQELIPRMQSNVHGSVQEKALPSSPPKIVSQDKSVLSQPCSAATSLVQSVVHDDGNVIAKSADVEKCSEPSRNEHLLDNPTPATSSGDQNAGSSANTQPAGISGLCNKILSTDHCKGMLKSSSVSTQNKKKTKPKRLTGAKVSSVRCCRKKQSEADETNHVQSGTPLLKSTCSEIVFNGCHSVCSANESSNKKTDSNLGHVVNKIQNKSEDLLCILADGEGTYKTAAVCSTFNEVSSSQTCDTTTCSSQDLREEALKVVTHCLKDLIFRVVSFPNKSLLQTAIASVVPIKGTEVQNSKEKFVEQEADVVKLSFTGCKSNENHSNNAVDKIEKKEEKCSESDVTSTCIDANHQCSDKSTKSVQVEIKNEEPSLLGEILQAALIPNIINATKCFINHECETSMHSLGLLDGNKLMSGDVNSLKPLCLDSSQHHSSVSFPDSSNTLSKCVSVDKSCEISLYDLGLCHQKYSTDDVALAENVKEKCLMIQRSLSRKKLANKEACDFTRTSLVTGVTCSLPLSKVSLALADCAIVAEAAFSSELEHSDVLPRNCCVAPVASNGSTDDLIEKFSSEGLNSPCHAKCNAEDVQLHVGTVNYLVHSVSSSAQTDVSYQNSFSSSAEVPSKFLFQVQPVHHLKLGDGQKLYACDICSGVYQRSFSLKRHYLRSHINYRHLTERDISNCGIIAGDKMAVQTGTNTKIYMQNSKITSQQLDCEHHKIVINKSELNVSSDCKQSTTVIHSEQNDTNTNSKTVDSSDESDKKNSLPIHPIEFLLKEEKSAASIQFPALYRCHFCGICFGVKEHLKSHLLNHPLSVTGDRKDTNSYVCDTCSLVFAHKHNYLRHCASDNHKTAAKPPSYIKEHLCLYCEKGFKTSATRKRHQNRVHHYFLKQKRPGKRPFHPCSYCPPNARKFKDLTILVKHMISSHTDKYHGCLTCSERFGCRDELNSHVDIVHNKNKPKILKISEQLKEAKCNNARLQMTVNKEENGLSNILGSLQKTNSGDHNKTQTKKSPEKKLSETVKEPTVDEDINPNCLKHLNSSKVNDEFRYTCGVCQKMFTNYVNMCRHRRLAHGTITAKSKKVKKGAASSESSGMCSTSSQSGDSRSESPSVASKTPADLSNKAQGTAHVVQPSDMHESQLDPETLFYSKIAINIRYNLLNHLDGKLSDNNTTITTTANTNSMSITTSSSTTITTVTTTAVATATTTTTTTKDIKAAYERSIAVDRPKRGEKGILKADCGAADSLSKDVNSVSERKQTTDGGRSKLSGKKGHIHKVPWEKYNFPKNYDGKGDGLASYIKDMSHLDISTQLVMQQNLQRLSFAGVKPKDAPPDCPENEEGMKDSDFPKGLCLVQRTLSSALSDVFNTSRHEMPLTRACSSSSVPSLLNSKDALVDKLRSNFTRRKSMSDIKIPSAGENCFRPSDDVGKDVELSGEWVRPRSYICGACSERFGDLYDLEDHKYVAHPNVWCTHFEFEESTITGMSFDISRCHASFPGNLSRRYLNATGTLNVAETAPPTAPIDSQCTKCSKNFSSLPELHRHILDCGGDTTWMLTMVAATSSGSRRNRKWRPFGSRRRRHQGRRGMKRNIPSSPVKLPQYRVRHRGSDNDSIQRMIANLPAKRASRRVLQFNDDEVKTRSQGTVHSNRILRKRFKVSTFVPNVHHRKPWSGRSSAARGLTFSQGHKMPSSEARSSKIVPNIGRVSSELTASKLLRSSKNFLQNKTLPKAIKDMGEALSGHQFQPTVVMDQKIKLLEKECDTESSTPKTRNMSAKNTQNDNVVTSTLICKVKRSPRFVRKSVISNIKSKYRNSMPVLSAETVSGKYRTSRRKIPRRKTDKNASVLSLTKDQIGARTDMVLPRRSGRTSVLREKINASMAESSTDEKISTVVETDVLNNCKLLPQTLSSTEGNVQCEEKLPDENTDKQVSSNDSVKNMDIKLDKRNKVRKMTDDIIKTKTKVLKVSIIKRDVLKTDVNEIAHKDCSLVCDGDLHPACEESSASQDKMESYVATYKKIPTPRICLSCGKKFKNISILERHLLKCGTVIKSRRRSTRTIQSSVSKTEVTKSKDIDENMPELQKEEPLEVLSVNESSKKCDDIANDIPVLSPVSGVTVSHTVDICNDEKCDDADFEGIRSRRKSKRGQKTVQSSGLVLNTEEHKNSESNSTSVKHGSLRDDKNSILPVVTQNQNVSSSESKNLKKMFYRRINKTNIPNAKDIENCINSTVISSDILQTVSGSPGNAELSKGSSLKSNANHKIDLSVAQTIVKMVTKKKDNLKINKNCVGKTKNFLKGANKKSKKIKEINSEENGFGIAHSDGELKTEIQVERNENMNKNTESISKTMKVKGQVIRKNLGVKQNQNKKVSQVRSSKRLSKVFSDNITEKIAPSCNKSLIQKSEAEIGNGHYRTSELLQVQEETIDKDSALLVECCKGSQNNCICSVMQVPQVSQDESSKILAESNNIKLSPGSREALCVFNNKEVANTCTKGISISPEKLDPKKELNISQNCFPSHVLHSDEDVKKSEIMVKDLLGLENPNVNNEKFKGENGRFCDVSGDVPNILNKLNNDLTNSKTDIQLEFKKAQHLVLRKKCRKVLNSPKFEMTKTVRNTLTPLNKKNSKINKTKHKNNKILCKEKSEDSSKKCTQNPNISDLEIDAAQVSDAVHSKPALKNLIANSHSTIEVKESLLDLGSSGEIKVTRIQDKLSSLQESCETGMSREQCNVLSRESVSSTETQMNTEMKLEGVPSTCVKQKISTISHTGRRKHKFPKIKSNFFPKCKFKKHHNHPKNSLPKLKSFEGNLNVNLLPFEGLESEGGKNIVAIDKNMSTEAEVTTRFLACDDTKKVDATKLHRFSNNSTYILFEMPTENEITKKSFSEPISNISDKKGCDKVCEVAETNCFENGIKCELKVVSDNVISPACRDESLCCINEEYQPGVAVGNVKKESSVTEIITFSESSLDADEDTLPIAKLREINLSRIRNLNRLNRNNRRHIKRNRKRRVKATEINHIEINCSGGYAVSKTKSLSDVCDTESPNCFVKIQEKTVLPVKDGDELCNDNLKSEENFSLVGNRLLRTRRNNSSDKNVLSQFERRESRARSTRWKLSYEEMYTSSDIASEADSQEFDSNQKENKSILRGHYRRRNRRMRNAKPRNNFLHQDKKRRKSLRRLTVLRNQRKAEMRLETKAFRNGKISLTKSSAINGTQEDHCKNVKMTLIENVFNLENCENVSSVKKYPDIVLESATEEETVSEITKTAVINKVFCKKPKKNNLHEMKMKGKNSVVIDLENTESLQAVLNTQHLESSVEQFRALNNKSSPHENLSFIDNNIIMSADCIKIKKIRSCELFKTDSILDGDCRDNAGENETNHYKKVTKLYEMSKTSDGRKAFTSKNMKSKNLRNLFVKRKDAKVMKIKTTQKRKRQKAKDSLKGHSNVLDQVGNTIPKQLIVTTVDGSDHISSIHLENKKMLHHNNTEYCVVGSAEGIRFPDALEKKIESKHDLDILSDTRLVLDKIVELADTTAKDEILSKEKFVCVLSEEEVSLQKAEISLPIIYTALSKEDTALSKEDTALSKEDTSLSDEDTSLSDEDTSLSKYDAALSKDDVVAQDDAVSLSKDDAALSKDVSLSDDGIAAHSGNCIATHSDDCIAARFDDGTASTSGDGSSHSDNGSALSKDEIALSKDEVALPIEATGFPTEATGFPTEATGLPTEATGLPSEATALPLEGIAFSNVDILNRSFYHTKTVENEMVVSLTSPHSLVQLPGREFSLSGVENSCDITEEEATTQTDSLELLNKSIYDNCVQKESELKNLHYCDICKKHFPSSSNLIKHKLSVFHKKNLAPEVSAYNNGATRAQTVANGSNPECSEEHSSMSDPIITEHYHQDGIDAVSVAENSLDVAFSFSDEVPLSIIAKNMSKNVRKQRKHKKLLTKTSSYKKKIKLENNDKNKRKHIQPKNKLHGKFKRKLLVEKESLKLCVTNKLFVTSGHITDMHYNCPSYQSKPSSTLHFIDDSNKVSSNTESESNSVCNNSTYTLACEEMKETNKCTLTTTSKMEPDSNVLSQLVECVKFMNHSDECKDETESVISKSLLHQPLSLAVLASRYLEEDVLDNMENAFIAPLNKINCFRDTAGKKRCLMAFEEIKKNEDDIVSHPQWQPSLKNIFALPPSFRELCFDSVLLSEVETQDNVLESENFTVEPSTLQNPETPLIPHMDSKFLHSNKNYECTEQTSCRELEKNIPLPEIQIPILLKTDIQGPSLNEEPLESDEKKIEKLTWPVFKIEDPKNCEGENVPVELPEDQHTLSLELDLDESLILQESSKTLQNKACPLQPPQLQQTPIFVERKLQPSLLQVTASSSLEDAKHVPGKIEKTDMKLNFLQIYDGPKLFPQELKSEGLLKQSAPQEYIASKEILQTSASQEKVALQKLVLQEENCKLPTAQNFGAGISKLGKTKKAYIPEKLQVQLPLLKIRDVQFLLAHHVDIQKTTYEDSDSQESMLEDSGIKNSRGQQSINVSLALVKSSDVSFSDNQIKLDQPAENKCEGGFNSSQDTEKLSLAVKEYEHNLCISIKTLPELPKVEENNLCAYVTELSQQEITLFDCSASLLEPKNQESPIDDCMSQMSLGKEPGCEQVTDIIDTLPISNVQEKNLHEYGDSMIPSEHGELDDRIETCDHLTSDMLPKPLNSTISVTAESVTEPQDNILLSNNQICTQVCENVITTEKDFRQQNGEKGSPMQSSEETNFPVPECEDGKQLLKYPYSETVSCPISAASNLEEDRLWRNQNNASEQPIANQTQIQILGNNAPWSQERDKCRDSDELPRKQISNGNSVLHDSLCEPVFRGSSHELFGGSQTLNPSGILGDSLCVQKTVVDVSSSSYDISTQASEMSQNPSWSQKCDSGDTVKDNSSVAQLKMEYSSLHRLAEVVIWSQSHTASPVLESALCRRTELGTSLKMSNGVTWPDSSSERNIHETAASEDNVNWPQKEQNINMFQDSSNEQADVHSSLTKISENKVVWSQNNKVCLPVFPECSHECVCPSSLKDSKNKYTWPENQEIRTSVLQNLADEQHEMHPPSLQISKTDAIVSQENENCVSVLQTLSNEQNEIHHPPVNISQNNLVWQHSGKPDCSLNQSSKHETLQPSVENTNNDLTWSQKENIGVAALQALSLAKDRINIMVDDTHMAQPQTSETYKFSPPTKQCNIHQPSYPDHDFNVCLPHHSEIVANDQQEYPLENVSVNPQLQSDSRSLQLHNQTSYTPIQQSPSLENRTLVPEVQSTFEESTTNEYENQFSSLEVNSAQVSLSQQEHMLKKLPLQLLKETEIECSVPQKPEVNAEILKESSINVPLQGENQTQVDPCAKLPNSEVHTASAKECENQLGYQVGNTAWCGSENGNWPNEQIQNSAGWSGQGELNSNTGWSDWVAGNMNWPQQTAPHIYSTAPVPAEGSLGSIIDSVNQILNEENASGVNSSEAAHVASDYNSYGTLPASCVVPRGLEELQRAMGATDEEMLMLQKLGENCCWPLENAEIMDLDGHKQMPEKNNTVQKIKEAEKATVISKPLENCTKKAAVSVSRRQRAEDRPFGHNQNILSQYESKEMVCPVCNKRFLGLTALQTHVTSAHNLDHATDRKAKATERSRQALISSIACSNLFQVNNSRHMCTMCKELHVDEASLRQHIEAMHSEEFSTPGMEDSQELRKSIIVNDQKAEGLKSQMSSALGGLLNRALSSVFISRLSREISARTEMDRSAESPENGETHHTGQEKSNQQLKADTDDTKEKQYVCELCELKFYHLESKNKHVQTVHLKLPRSISLGDTVPELPILSTGDGNNKEEHENESAWVSESPPEWTADSNIDGEILDGSFLCQDCGINFQTPHEVLSHRQLEHPPPPPSESQPESVADRNMDIPTSDKPGLIDDSDNAATVPENVADVTSSCTDNVTSVADGSGGVEDITNLAAASCNVSSQIVSEKTVEKFLLSSCLGRMGEVSARKVAKSKMTLEELEKQLCRNNAIIKAKAEAAIRELSLTRKGRNSAANTRWGVQRYKFVVPDRQPSSDKNKEKVVLQADDKYNYPLIRKVSNSRFASLTERKKKLGSKPESLSCDKDKEKREKDVLEPDSSSVDVYEFDDDDSATKGISLRGVAVLPTCKSIMQGKEYDAHTDSGKDCVQQTVVSTEQNTTKSVISDMPCDKLDNYVSDCNFRVQQLELGSEITCSDQNVFSEENVIKENTCTHQELQCVTKVMVTEGLNKFVCGTEKCLNCKELVREEGEKPEVNELYKCPKSSEQKALSGVEVSNISVKNSVKNNKAKLGTNRKLVQKQNANDQGIENNKESKSVKSSKKRKTNESFELPPSKHTFQADSSKSEPQEIMPLGRRQVKKVSYVELYDSEVDEQFLFYSDDEIPPLNDSKLKPKCKNPKKKQSKSDRKKRKYDQPVVQQGESCGSETVTHVHKKRCKQKLQSVDVSSSAPKSDDISETCRIESPVIEANKFQPKWLCTSEPVTDEDNTSESDQSDRQKTTKTDLLKTVFAKSRRNSTTIVSGSGGTIPEVDEGRTNTHSVKHKHRS